MPNLGRTQVEPSSEKLGAPKRVCREACHKRGMKVHGQKLRGLRNGLRIKQVEAAEFAGISGSHLSKVEAGEDNLSLEAALKLAILYRVGLDEIAPNDEALSRVEVAIDPDEVDWLRTYRHLSPEERAGARALTKRRA